MRYGLISDIHGNLEALEAVLGALSSECIDAYLCVGDVIGYGANPKECLARVRSLKPEALIAGNHEWGVLDLLGIDYFNKYAQKAILWAKEVLDDEEKKYLRSFKMSWSAGDITLVHGSLVEPERFYYIFDAQDAAGTLESLRTRLCFVGHSHLPGIFYSDGGNPGSMAGLRTGIENGRRYVINVGSVGQPRDGDPRASFAIYDSDAWTVDIKRVRYDIGAAQRKILAAGLPAYLADRLSEGH